MGDRANARIIHDADTRRSVYLYTHWSGTELPEIMRQGLNTPAARGHWADAPYLTRLLADALSQHSGGPGHGTGMGIAPDPCDDNHGATLTIDVPAQEVYYERLTSDLCQTDEQIGPRIPFETFARHSQMWPEDCLHREKAVIGIAANGVEYRCTACGHQWFQERVR